MQFKKSRKTNTKRRENLTFFKFNGAFTLVEVMIALLIIGIVAVYAILTINQNIQHKELEASFKKGYSSLVKVTEAINADGVSVYNDYYNIPAGDSTRADKQKDFLYMLAKKYNTREICEITRAYYDGNPVCRAPQYQGYYLGGIQSPDVMPYGHLRTLDGMYIFPGNWGLYLSIDVNGAKGPNRAGHDLFSFGLTSRNALYVPTSWGTTTACSKTTTTNYSGVYCAYYALQNQCPEDSIKTYWECLP